MGLVFYLNFILILAIFQIVFFEFLISKHLISTLELSFYPLYRITYFVEKGNWFAVEIYHFVVNPLLVVSLFGRG